VVLSALKVGELLAPCEDLVGIDVELAGQARHGRPLDERFSHDGALEFGAVLPVGAALAR
jgi:hypothetical protein